jgi:hypothetical protein
MGAIALMPEEPVPTSFGNVDAYLVEVRSIGGLSGSPVFVWSAGPRIIGNERSGGGVFAMLGLVHGHWDIPHDAASPDTGFESERLNVGIAVVVPAHRVLEVFDHPTLAARRKVAIEHTAARFAQK